MGLAVVVVAIGVTAYALGRKDTATATASAPMTTKVLSSTSEVRATSTPAPPSSTTSTSTTSTPSSSATGGATPLEAGRSAAVVFYTYGVTAKGYPSFDTIIAPTAQPAVESMMIGADYRNAGCSQVVESIQEDPIPNPPTYGFDLDLLYQCPDQAPTSSADGSPLPLTEDLYVEVTTASAPNGGYWATQIQIVDNN